jgi:hypothetical protein
MHLEGVTVTDSSTDAAQLEVDEKPDVIEVTAIKPQVSV